MDTIQSKYKLNKNQRDFLRSKRIEKNISAENLSVQYLHKSKAWLGQLERGRVSSIKKSDLLQLLSFLLDISVETVVEKNILYDFLHNKLDDTKTFSWFNYEKWDCWNEFETNDMHPYIIKELKKFIDAICQYENNASTQKMRFIIWHTLLGLNKNLSYSFELTSLLNCIPLSSLEGLTTTHKIIEKNKLLELYECFAEYEDNLMMKKVVPSNNSSLENIREELAIIGLCSNILYQMLTSPVADKTLIEEYNKNVQSINESSNKYGFSKKILSSIIDFDNLPNNIIERYMPELQKITVELNEQKSIIESKINDDFSEIASKYLSVDWIKDIL